MSREEFVGGELRFHPHHVELCGVIIASDLGGGQIFQLLRELSENRMHGRITGLSAETLAARIGADGASAVTAMIRNLRKTISARLLTELGLICGSQSVIENDRVHGYRLAKVIIPVFEPEAKGATLTVETPVNPPRASLGQPVTQPFTQPLSQPVSQPFAQPVSQPPSQPVPRPSSLKREQDVLRLLTRRPMRLPELVNALQCSLRTGQRTVDSLRSRGLIVFRGPCRTGNYRLVGQAEDLASSDSSRN